MNQIKEKVLRKMRLRDYAMHFGTLFGLVWIARFGILLLGLNDSPMMMIYVVSVLCIPVMLMRATRRYRRQCGGVLGFWDALQLCVLSCFYAALLTAVAHYVFFRYIDRGYVAESYATLIAQLKEQAPAGQDSLATVCEEALGIWNSLSPIDITLQMMSNNLFWGAMVSIPIALLMYRKPKAGAQAEPQAREPRTQEPENIENPE
jgi:hypothetical protein